MKIAIVQYDSGNIQSVFNAIDFLGYSVELVSSPALLDDFDIIILPGVGAFEPAMTSLKKSGFKDKLDSLFLAEDKLIIGICLGMQLMCNSSLEGGDTKGLGWINADVVSLKSFSASEKVPHIGWNNIVINNPLEFEGVHSGKDFYFVHSYCVICRDASHSLATTEYCTQFSSIVKNKRAIGLQFHPEKSHSTGLNLLGAIISSKAGYVKPIFTDSQYA